MKTSLLVLRHLLANYTRCQHNYYHLSYNNACQNSLEDVYKNVFYLYACVQVVAQL